MIRRETSKRNFASVFGDVAKTCGLNVKRTKDQSTISFKTPNGERVEFVIFADDNSLYAGFSRASKPQEMCGIEIPSLSSVVNIAAQLAKGNLTPEQFVSAVRMPSSAVH